MARKGSRYLATAPHAEPTHSSWDSGATTTTHGYMSTLTQEHLPPCEPRRPGKQSTGKVQRVRRTTLSVGWVLTRHQPVLYCTTATAVVQVCATQQYKHLHVLQAWGLGSRPEVL